MKSQSGIGGEEPPKTESKLDPDLVRHLTGRRALLEEEALPAAAAGVAALRRIAEKIVGRDHGGAVRLRKLLLSLFRGEKVSLSDVCYLDWENRKDFAAVVLGIDLPGFPDYLIREVFKEAGDFEAEWFLGGPRTIRQSKNLV